MHTPITELDARYSEPEATPTQWDEAAAQLAAAPLTWLSTVRPDGRPHVTPLITVMSQGLLHFTTGPGERKARNLDLNPAVALTTGCNDLHGGTDYVVEGIAERVTDPARLRELADAWVEKYGEQWRFEVVEDAFQQREDSGPAHVYTVRATQAFGFGKAPYSQTRWRFAQ
jgi:nitroimidazol reductase NimA-like FMN-containing flavoprotein (pyridoxamine 5'-phosphate oxidase superfamily)